MKKLALALMLVMVLSTSAFAETAVTGEVSWGFTKTGDADIAWDSAPNAKIKVAGDNFAVRFVTNPYAENWTDADKDGVVEDKEGVDSAYLGAKFDTAVVKSTFEGIGTLQIGLQSWLTSDVGSLDQKGKKGFTLAGSVDSLSYSGLWVPADKILGGRVTYGLELAGLGTTLGGTIVKAGDADASIAGDAKVVFAEGFDAYLEVGEDILTVGGDASVAGIAVNGSYDTEAKTFNINGEKAFGGVTYHVEYEKADAADGKLTAYAKVTF